MAPSDSTPNTRAFLAMNGAGCSHPALDTTGLVFDQGRRAWIDRNHANPTISTAASRFRKALEALERECPQQTTSQLSIRSGHSWKDVLSVAGSAVAEKKDRSIKSFFSRGVDKAGAHAASIEQVFSALKPDGEYTSIICGGFSLILRAFARLPKLRKEAIDVVASAPQLLERTERLIALDADQALQDKADALYVALLYVLEEIISWYPHIGKNLIVEIALPGLSFDKKGKIAHLNNCVAELEKQSDLCNKERLYSLALTLHSFMAQAEKNHDETAEMQRKILEGQKRLDFNQNVMMALMGSIYGGPVPHVQPLVPFERFLASTEEKYKLGQDVHINDIRKLIYGEQAVISHLASPPPPKTMYSTEIIRQLGVDAADGAADAVLELVKARRDNPSLRLISPLLSDPRFRLWLTSATSDLLFVLPEAAHPRDSDTAYITASIYRTLQQMPTAITLVHFCAQQNRTKTREAVYDMMAHLVSQLLTCSWLSAFPCSASFVEQCAAGDLKALSELLEHLLSPAALPNATVYLLIDGFATAERDDEEADYGALVRLVDQLKRIVNTSSPGRSPVVKILIMEPDFRGDIISGSNPDEILRLLPARHVSRESNIGIEYAQLLPGNF